MKIKNQILIMAVVISSLLAGRVFASETYNVVCDDNNIFEVPLQITISNGHAEAAGMFSGPGDALFMVKYKALFADVTTQASGEIESISVSQPHVVGTAPGFDLNLKATSKNTLKGKVSMISTDEDKIPYEGEVTCTVTSK